ncbi:MAG: fumarylacetoacetate hydrolase family protein [Chloroflexota bacterium]|nr:fumarylacetoacetate hydrolase family protein [Chloroflexota bacterium]
MKLVTYEQGAEQKIGAVVGDHVVDLATASGRELPRTMLEFIGRGEEALETARQVLRGSPQSVPLAEVRLLAPIPRPPRNVMCVGWNYAEHFEEGQGRRGPGGSDEMPEYPTFFTKLPTSIIGPGEGVQFDARISTKLDWEVELAVIIGRSGRDIQPEQAMEHVFGYTIANDVSVRDVQRRHGNQWFRGKSMDTHCPLGPWIVTADELSDPQQLHLSCRVNGELKQDASTEYMVFQIPRLIQELSLGTTLQPGDVVLTGTPSGVGFARTPPEYLKPGDVMELEIEGIGKLANPVVAYPG